MNKLFKNEPLEKARAARDALYDEYRDKLWFYGVSVDYNQIDQRYYLTLRVDQSMSLLVRNDFDGIPIVVCPSCSKAVALENEEGK